MRWDTLNKHKIWGMADARPDGNEALECNECQDGGRASFMKSQPHENFVL
jgi:hypothetical protein